jgi:threonine dehydratase
VQVLRVPCTGTTLQRQLSSLPSAALVCHTTAPPPSCFRCVLYVVARVHLCFISAVFIHPYNNNAVMAGQGTIAIELLESLPELHAIIVPVSGGGMAAGIAAYAKGVKPSLRVFAVEPEGKGLGESLATGTRQLTASLAPLDTIADGIRTKTTGDKPWAVLDELLEKEVLVVDDEQIVEGLRFSLHRIKLVVEPAGASVQNVALVVCGGNADLNAMAALL